MRGYVQVYTGDGKGKTTAALGLTLRAVGAGLKVYIAQFIKKGDYSEINALKRLAADVTLEQFGCGRFTKGKACNEDIAVARKGLARIKEIVSSGEYELVILDEANVAVTHGLITEQELLDIIDQKPEHMELVITGRNAPAAIVDKADLVSEVKAIKHYFKKGVNARIGIEK
ncbi:MAG: cob(I)yrinic acid a,c-diamide adenosyltransferase [Desulfobacterales bacterium]|jgi:cob(I)alamin adenosyltransferase